MKSKIYIGIGTLLLIAGIILKSSVFTISGTVFVAFGFFLLVAVSSGIEYSESHYRFYKRIAFWKIGHWKSILGVRRIYIRYYTPTRRNSLWRSSAIPLAEQREEFQVYFVRKSGYYKIFQTFSLEEARQQAKLLSVKYNLKIKEKERAEGEGKRTKALLTDEVEQPILSIQELV